MTLAQFINHIKHKNITIMVHVMVNPFSSNDTLEYCGTIGEYNTSVARATLDKLIVDKVYPQCNNNKDTFIIVTHI